MPVTPYFENLVLQYAVRGQTFVIGNWWAGLSSTTNGSVALDVGRVLVTWDDSFANENELAWLPAPEAVSVRSLTLWDAQSGGNRIAHGVSSTLPVNSGSIVVAAPGAVQLEMPAS